MALLTKHVYANKLYAHLAAAATNSQTTLTFYPEEIASLLSSWNAGSWLFLCLMSPDGTVEIVKMTGLSGHTLTVERGQGGTTARAWPAGTLVASRVVAEYLERFHQRGDFRSGAYNPNGTLEGQYTGEKFYQTGPAAGQKRWWINTIGTKWRLLTGLPYGWEVRDENGYWVYMPIWTEYSDPSLWTPNNVTWQAGDGFWRTDFNTTGSLTVNGSWADGETWPDIRIQVQNYEGGFAWLEILDSGSVRIDPGQDPPNYYCYEERKITWGANRLNKISWDARPVQVNFKVFVNEGTPWEVFEKDYVERTTSAYWNSDYGKNWDGSGWPYDQFDTVILLPKGTWANAYRPQTCRLTANGATLHAGSLKGPAPEERTIGSFLHPGIWSEGYAEIEFDLCGYQNVDIDSLRITPAGVGKLIKIEFGEDKW